jgi:8-oxo-dGTP pyrophosphatase MutT (NUDIX family)
MSPFDHCSDQVEVNSPDAIVDATMSGMRSVDDVELLLARHEPRLIVDESESRRAAVAAVLRDGHHGVEMLLIHRAEHPEDPWSGHMAFPGGRVDPGDNGPLAAAMRETREEIDLDLQEEARLIGRLSDVRAVAKGRRLPLVIVPYVFRLTAAPLLEPNHEVAAIVWVPMVFLEESSNRSVLRWRHRGVDIPLPCYRYQGHVIWGLTLQMLDELLTLVGEAPQAWG